MNNAMIEEKIRPPFGSNVKRFLPIGYHPLLDTRPETFRNVELGPGSYKWNKPRKIVSKVPRWKRQEEVEEFSRRLGFRNDRILEKAKWIKSINGPGWQDLRFPLSSQSFSFCKAARFPIRKVKTFGVPGPGFYGKNHVPYTVKEEKSRNKGFSFSIIPPFEQRSSSRSFYSQLSYHLPPNQYSIKSSIQEFISKRVSKRGPYDLFSVERFPDPKSNNIPQTASVIKTSDLNHLSNSFKGEFLICRKDSLTTSRLVITDLKVSKKNSIEPGPGHYDPYPTPTISQARAPFNSSVLEARPATICAFSPPPGRYNPVLKRRIIGNGMKSVFVSKVKRNLPQVEKLSWFE